MKFNVEDKVRISDYGYTNSETVYGVIIDRYPSTVPIYLVSLRDGAVVRFSENHLEKVYMEDSCAPYTRSVSTVLTDSTVSTETAASSSYGISMGADGAYTYFYETPNINNNNKNNMDLKEKFVLAVTPEPQKSFRKAGITDGDNLLTQEGQRIFLTWLLGKYADEFKKDVVDGLLEKEK